MKPIKSERLRKLEGVVPPIEPEGFHHVYHMYKIALTNALTEKYHASKQEIRDNILFALKAEGVTTALWVQDVLPGMDIYKLRIGYGNGCPWTCPFGPKGKGREVTYNPADYPEAKRLIESTFNLDYFYPPNQKEYLDGVILAFEKIWDNLDTILG